MKQRLGCYRRNYLHWENQHKVLLQPHKWEVPAQALTQIITEQGFTIKRASVADDSLKSTGIAEPSSLTSISNNDFVTKTAIKRFSTRRSASNYLTLYSTKAKPIRLTMKSKPGSGPLSSFVPGGISERALTTKP